MIHRIEVRAIDEANAEGHAVAAQLAELGFDVGRVRASRIFLIDSDEDADLIVRTAGKFLADPIVDQSVAANDASANRIEIHLKPGVMDPVAASTEMSLKDLGIAARQVRTGRAYELEKQLAAADLGRIASRALANGVIESVHIGPFRPDSFEAAHDHAFALARIELTQLSDDGLKKLSRDGHLFLSLPEMKAIQAYFLSQRREPTDIELETIAQTWSEHCVHKTLKSAVEVVDDAGQVLRRYENLIGQTIFASTMELMQRQRVSGGPEFCLSVFKDNAGVIAFDERHAVCFKVETHNHPSAIEPYGGSATGAGGVIRDILGTGLAARPFANTDVFCVAFPDRPLSAAQLPKGVIHPKRVLRQVVAGVRDYGNRMGIPTINGAVYFDENYVGNPLVFCGCAGLIPRNKIEKQTRGGDAIVVMGGRTGRDGIHGATFSSAELTDTHADEFSHAVQIGNAITEKKLADVILQARDLDLFTAITDCGAGGLSSAIGEMGEKTGARVELDSVPLKYAGLRYDEIWISEAQERMVLAVPADRVDELLALANSEGVEATVVGRFGTDGANLILNYRGQEVGRLSMHFLHDGLPKTARRARISLAPVPAGEGRGEGPIGAATSAAAATSGPLAQVRGRGDRKDFRAELLRLLAHPNIASKHWIIRQYDHEVGGGSVIKPLVGPRQMGPGNAAVVRPKLNSFKGVALGCGLAPQIEDPYEMSLAAIDEAIRNVLAVGAHPDQIAILDNFCWPSVDDEQTMGTLVRACEACRDAALAYGIPFISGKDSLHNQFTDSETGRVIKIPRTLLISAIAVISDVRKCVTMDFKKVRSPVYLVAAGADLPSRAKTHRALAELISDGIVAACHDVSDGGYAAAAAEMAIASGIGVGLDPALFDTLDPFAETPGRYLIELRQTAIEQEASGAMAQHFEPFARFARVGFTRQRPELILSDSRMGEVGEKIDAVIGIEELTQAWRGTLDW